MCENISSRRPLRTKIAEIFSAPFRNFCAFLTSLYCGVLVTCPTFALAIQEGADTDALFGNLVEIIIEIAFYVGALITVGGVFSLIVAYKDDNADGQTRAVRLIVIGVVLIGFRELLKLAGILS